MNFNGKILKQKNILLSNRSSVKNNENYNLGVILLKDYGIYKVILDCEYPRDNYYMAGKNAFDDISYPISKALIKEFDNLEEADKFFNKVSNTINRKVKPFKLSFLKKETKIDNIYYIFDFREQMDYDIFGHYELPDENYMRVLANFDYDSRLVMRIYRKKSKIIINRKIEINFKDEIEAKKGFKLLVEHFDNLEIMDISSLDFPKEQCHSFLNSIINNKLNIPLKYLRKLEYSYDEFGRFNKFYIELENDRNEKVEANLKLPTRNAVYWNCECKGNIYCHNMYENSFFGIKSFEIKDLDSFPKVLLRQINILLDKEK